MMSGPSSLFSRSRWTSNWLPWHNKKERGKEDGSIAADGKTRPIGPRPWLLEYRSSKIFIVSAICVAIFTVCLFALIQADPKMPFHRLPRSFPFSFFFWIWYDSVYKVPD